jgi:UPF0716 protein FxsA
MLFLIFILFLSWPFLEVFLLVKMARSIGFWPTLGVQILTAILGAALARLQGWIVWVRIQKELLAGRLPARELLDGVLILAAGIVLLTPGLISDALGLLILFPPTRALFRGWLTRRFQRAASRRTARVIDVMPGGSS